MNSVVTRMPSVRNKKIACGRQIAAMLRNPTTTGDKNQAAALMHEAETSQQHAKGDEQPGRRPPVVSPGVDREIAPDGSAHHAAVELVNMPVRVTTSTNIPYRSTPSPWIMNGVRTRLPATPVSWPAVPQLKPRATPRRPGGFLSPAVAGGSGPGTATPAASRGVAVPGIPVVSSGSIKVASGPALGSLSSSDEDRRAWLEHVVSGGTGPKV